MQGLGLDHFSFIGLPPVDLVRLARQSGFDFVGLRFHPVAPGELHHCPAPGSDAIRALRGALADEGMRVQGVESVVIDRQFDPRSVMPALAASAEVGAKRLNVCAEDWDRAAVLDRFAQLCELAATAGMAVDLECMKWRGIDCLTKCLEIVEGAGAENAGVLIDILHLARCGDTATDVAALPPARVRAAQLCDAPGAAPTTPEARIAEARKGRLPPGEGALPIAEVVAALPEGTSFSIEVPSPGAPDCPLTRARHLYAAALPYLPHPPVNRKGPAA